MKKMRKFNGIDANSSKKSILNITIPANIPIIRKICFIMPFFISFITAFSISSRLIFSTSISL